MVSDPVSPCILVCVMDAGTGLCLGCHRTLDEIASWSTASAHEKQIILDRIADRQTPRQSDAGR